MKKILILLLILSGCTKYIYDTPQKTDRNVSVTLTDVNLGTAPNSGNGDPLRTAFGKVNANNTLIESAFGNIYTETQTETLIADSLDALRDSAFIANDYVFLKPDSNEYGGAITRTYFETYGGGGGTATGGYEWTSWIVGTTTGAPSNADTSFTIADFAGDRIELARGTDGDLSEQWLNETATNGKPGYRYNSSGVVVVRPAWATGDMAYLRAVPQGYTTKVSLSGTGGGSSLETNLVGGWQLNESSGSVAFSFSGGDYLPGTISGALVNQAGKFGTAFDFDGTNDYVNMGTDAYLRMTGDFSISVWVKTTMGGWGTFLSNYISLGGNFYGYQMSITDGGKVECAVLYGNSTDNTIEGSTSIDDGNWHNIIFTYATATDVINVYVDGGASEDNNNVAGTITYYTTNEFHLGDRGEGDLPFDGVIDAAFVWSRLLTSDERTVLQTYTYPFE